MRLILLMFSIVLFQSCSKEKQPINFGMDACVHCKMTIVDERYGAELITAKGKIYKYDALECLVNHLNDSEAITEKDVHSIYAIDYGMPKTLVSIDSLEFLISKELPSPMGMYLTCFKNPSQLEQVKQEKGGEILNWQNVQQHIKSNVAWE